MLPQKRERKMSWIEQQEGSKSYEANAVDRGQLVVAFGERQTVLRCCQCLVPAAAGGD